MATATCNPTCTVYAVTSICSSNIPVNCPDFFETVPILGFQDLQKWGRPDFLEFQQVNIPVFESFFRHKSVFFLVFFCKLEISDYICMYEWLVDLSVECSA